MARLPYLEPDQVAPEYRDMLKRNTNLHKLLVNSPDMARAFNGIGNSGYKTSPLRNPVNDARATAALLRQIGFEVIDGYDLDYANMRRAISDFLVRVAAAKVAVVYYAGHGLQVDGRNYLAPIDARLEDKRTAGLELFDMDQILTPIDDPSTSSRLR